MENLKTVELRNNKEKSEKSETICLYQFTNFYELWLCLCKIRINSSKFTLSKSAMRNITKRNEIIKEFFSSLISFCEGSCNLDGQSINIMCKCHWRKIEKITLISNQWIWSHVKNMFNFWRNKRFKHNNQCTFYWTSFIILNQFEV